MDEKVFDIKARIDDFTLKVQDGTVESGQSDAILVDLTALEKLNIDRDVLANTKIGISLTKLSKASAASHELVSVKAKEIIKKLKENLRSEAQTPKKRQKTEAKDQEESPKFVYKGKCHGDDTRDKALCYLYKSFMSGKDFKADEKKVADLVYEMELFLYKLHVIDNHSQRDYNQQLKAIVFNLKDLKNTRLNLKIYKGEITPAQMACMPSTEMASDEKKSEREVILQESLQACQSDWAVKNIFLNKNSKSKGQFRCFKCNSQDTVYQQLQTRSSDEPMTTFVTCLQCSNRWKF